MALLLDYDVRTEGEIKTFLCVVSVKQLLNRSISRSMKWFNVLWSKASGPDVVCDPCFCFVFWNSSGLVLFFFLLTLSLLITCYPDGEDRGFRGQLAWLQKVQKEFFFFNHLS